MAGGFEPETKVQHTTGPRWGVDQQNYGWKSNMPSPYLDDLNGGLENGFKKDRFPDFSIGTANARALKYNTLYYTRNVIDKGETNTGYVVARGAPTHRPSVLQQAYCYGKARGQDSGCYFRERVCTVGVDQVPMSRSRRYKFGWSQQEATTKCVR